MALLLAGCGFEQLAGPAMGTSYRVQADCPGSMPASLLADTLERIDARMSTYDADSELAVFNRAAVGEKVPVSAELVHVVEAAHRVSTATEGAFDATVAPLVSLWGFGADAAEEWPDEAAVAKVRTLVDYRNLRYQSAPPLLQKLAPLQLDLSAIAKGYAVDQLAAVLQAAGCRSYLVELGGEIRVAGIAPSGTKWRIGIESPSGEQALTTLVLSEGALATTGDYRQHRQRDGKRISHIVDPRSGWPVSHRLASVTVVAQTALLADAYATALTVLGTEAGSTFAEEQGLAALFVTRADDGFETSETTAMRAYR